MRESNWAIQKKPYLFKELQKIYGKSVNSEIRRDLRFICFEEWEKEAFEKNKFLSKEDCVYYQIDFEFKEAYNQLIKTIKETDFDLEVTLCSKIKKENTKGYWASREYSLYLEIINKKTNKKCFLNNPKEIDDFCFQMKCESFLLRIALRFNKKSFYDFLYGKNTLKEAS